MPVVLSLVALFCLGSAFLIREYQTFSIDFDTYLRGEGGDYPLENPCYHTLLDCEGCTDSTHCDQKYNPKCLVYTREDE